MYQETVNVPYCSYNLQIIKVNQKSAITFVCSTLYLCNKFSISQPLADISHIQLFCSPFNISHKQIIDLTETFHVKSFIFYVIPLSFLPLVSFEIIQCRFSQPDFYLSFRPLTEEIILFQSITFIVCLLCSQLLCCFYYFQLANFKEFI